jgi:hypothetical protein
MSNKKMTAAEQVIFSWELETDLLARYFAKRYFGKDVEEWWLADEVSGVYCIGDYFFNLEDMVDFIRYKYTAKDMFAYYDYSLDFQEKEYERNPKLVNKMHPINIKNWKKLK